MDPQALPIRDIHLPPPVGWWPPAPGWWLLLVAVLLLALSGYWWRRRLARRRVKKTALVELGRLRNDVELDATEKLRQLSVLMRRVAISVYPRADVAGLAGAAWLEFLDTDMVGHPFSQGPGTVLADGPYRPQAVTDLTPLFDVCEAWIGRRPEEMRR